MHKTVWAPLSPAPEGHPDAVRRQLGAAAPTWGGLLIQAHAEYLGFVLDPDGRARAEKVTRDDLLVQLTAFALEGDLPATRGPTGSPRPVSELVAVAQGRRARARVTHPAVVATALMCKPPAVTPRELARILRAWAWEFAKTWAGFPAPATV